MNSLLILLNVDFYGTDTYLLINRTKALSLSYLRHFPYRNRFPPTRSHDTWPPTYLSAYLSFNLNSSMGVNSQVTNTVGPKWSWRKRPRTSTCYRERKHLNSARRDATHRAACCGNWRSTTATILRGCVLRGNESRAQCLLMVNSVPTPHARFWKMHAI